MVIEESISSAVRPTVSAHSHRQLSKGAGLWKFANIQWCAEVAKRPVDFANSVRIKVSATNAAMQPPRGAALDEPLEQTLTYSLLADKDMEAA